MVAEEVVPGQNLIVLSAVLPITLTKSLSYNEP